LIAFINRKDKKGAFVVYRISIKSHKISQRTMNICNNKKLKKVIRVLG